MIIRALLAFLFLASAAQAQTGASPGDVTLRVEIEEREHTPFVSELVLISVHGSYRLPITLERLEQPSLEGFNWMQLGEDLWYITSDRGQEVVNFQRRVALFPQSPGRLKVGGFTHHLSLLSRSGHRFEHTVTSEPVEIEVRAHETAGEWWFPVDGIHVTDNWSNAPERLQPGEGALRIVTLTVSGIEPERVPPMPEMTAAGAHVFAHPEKRIVTLRPQGPLTRIFWRWTIRPSGDTAGFTNPVTVPYFDTATQEAKSFSLSAQRVAYLGAPDAPGERPAEARAEETGFVTALEWPAAPSSGWFLALGFLAGLLLLPRMTMPGRKDIATLFRALAGDPCRRQLRLAARSGNPARTWKTAHALLAGAEPPKEMHLLEATLFSESRIEPPDLRSLARAVIAASRQSNGSSTGR